MVEKNGRKQNSRILKKKIIKKIKKNIKEI